jgi:hypothetical protein
MKTGREEIEGYSEAPQRKIKKKNRKIKDRVGVGCVAGFAGPVAVGVQPLA